jgi:SAM-dependent methyltransferase
MIVMEEAFQPVWFDDCGPLASVWAAGRKARGAFSWAAESVRARGWRRTIKVVASVLADFWFDWRYGTETRRVVDVDSLGTDSANRMHAIHYQPTKARPFRRLLRRLRLPDEAVFVDFGSGKGRVLLLAAEAGLRRVVGIDFCPRLCAVARRNVEIFRRKVPALAPVEVIEADVTAHRLRDDETVFFFYNPFDGVILGRVLEQIRQSLARRPRPAWLIYCVPAHGEVVEAAGIFSRRETVELGGMEFRVYSEPTVAGRRRNV